MVKAVTVCLTIGISIKCMQEVVIGEAKFGTSRLNKNTSMGPQISDG